jgi:hypothetical protein
VWLVHPEFGFVSIVGHRNLPGHVLVRGRDHAHLRELQVRHPDLLGSVPIEQTPTADYAVRFAPVTAEVMAEVLRRESIGIRYDNVKAEAARRWGHGSAFVAAMHTCWSALRRLQIPFRRDQIDDDLDGLR